MNRSCQPRILVAEADEAIAVALRKVLERAGYDVFATCDAEQAALRLAEGTVDLLLLDPDTFSDESGVFCRWLQQAGATPPIVLLSGTASATARREAARFGALLEKPPDAAVLLETIFGMLNDLGQRRDRQGTVAAAVIIPRLRSRSKTVLPNGLRPRSEHAAVPNTQSTVSPIPTRHG